jgi:predicted ATPase
MSTVQRTELVASGATISGLTNINLILGRNGVGKSRFLRSLEERLANDDEFNVRYLSPERAGVFQKGGTVEANMQTNKHWLRMSRNRNQAGDFKQVLLISSETSR